MQLIARHYDTGLPVRLEIVGKKLAGITPCADQPAERLPWIAPGLIDLQMNGYGGQWFCDRELTTEKVVRVVHSMDAFGVAKFCPTVITESFDVLAHAMRTIVATCDQSPEIAGRIAGIHLEGPYISPKDGTHGAHPLDHCRRPDLDEFKRLQEAADGRICILTMAVEFDRSPEFIRHVADSGVVVSIGHTAAEPDQIRAAVDAGARMSTHLGNGSSSMLHRHRNHLWPQLADDRLTAGLIVDGHHLPAEVVKTFVRVKTPERCILVSDLSGMAGLPPGRYDSELCESEILPDGRLVVAGQREILAGASLPIGTGIANVMRFADVTLRQAVAMAVDNPANLLGLEIGGIQPGEPAVLFDLDEQFEVRSLLLS